MKLLKALRIKPIRDSMRLYESKLKQDFMREEFQIDDWEMAENELQCCFLRSRGGSKTNDFTTWLIFHVLRTNERWAWLSSKSGQLDQALIYVRENPFVKEVKRITNGKYNVYLWTGKMIRFGLVSTSNLGLRLDGIVYDEEQDNRATQRSEIYPQMAGMLTASTIHKEIHLGTRWINTLLDEHIESYPTSTRDWEQCPWLVNSGFIKSEIDAGVTPDWQIDLLYRCIPTAPGGVLFPNLIVEDLKNYVIINAIQYGVDFGSKDMIVGISLVGNHCYVLFELAVELETNNYACDFMKNRKVEAEGGGYNVSERYGAKGKVLQQRLSASLIPVTNKWKSDRQMYSRGLIIHVDKHLTPNIYSDLKSASFGLDGLYLKDTTHPCHYLDAFFHATKANLTGYLQDDSTPYSPSKSSGNKHIDKLIQRSKRERFL